MDMEIDVEALTGYHIQVAVATGLRSRGRDYIVRRYEHHAYSFGEFEFASAFPARPGSALYSLKFLNVSSLLYDDFRQLKYLLLLRCHA